MDKTAIQAVYRQLLRYSAASVAYHKYASIHLRHIYGQHLRYLLRTNGSTLPPAVLSKVHETLRFLQFSSLYKRSLPHRLTANLSHLTFFLLPPLLPKPQFSTLQGIYRPFSLSRGVSKFVASSTLGIYRNQIRDAGYLLPHVEEKINRAGFPKRGDDWKWEKARRAQKVQREAWNALANVVNMAERTSGIYLGRVRPPNEQTFFG